MSDVVVHNYDEFLTYRSNGNYNIKFANPHEVEGVIVLTGDGSQNNPYVCSSYEEMLFATGASNIYAIKLFDRALQLYVYTNGNNEKTYCLFDSSLSTIDFNDINNGQPFTSEYRIQATVNFNGWTWKNFSCVPPSGSSDCMIRFDNYCKNARFSNFTANGNGNGRPFIGQYSNTYDSENNIFDLWFNNTSSSSDSFMFACYSYYSYRSFINSSITIHGRGYRVKDGDSGTRYKQCIINYDLINTGGACPVSKYENCLLIGDMYDTQYNSHTTSTEVVGGEMINTIIDFEKHTGSYFSKYGDVTASSFYNKNKFNTSYINATNLYPADEDELKNASWLAERGFPIGVDS